jgi:hypothetical protein
MTYFVPFHFIKEIYLSHHWEIKKCKYGDNYDDSKNTNEMSKSLFDLLLERRIP